MRVIKGCMRGTRSQETRASTKCQMRDPSTRLPATAGGARSITPRFWAPALSAALLDLRAGIPGRSAPHAVGGQHAR